MWFKRRSPKKIEIFQDLAAKVALEDKETLTYLLELSTPYDRAEIPCKCGFKSPAYGARGCFYCGWPRQTQLGAQSARRRLAYIPALSEQKRGWLTKWDQ